MTARENMMLTKTEKQIIIAYRKSDNNIQYALRRLLQIEQSKELQRKPVLIK